MYGRRKGSKLKRERHAQCRGGKELVAILERRERKDGRKCSLELMVGRTISYSSPGSLWG